jgi:predicted transcriptional regulator
MNDPIDIKTKEKYSENKEIIFNKTLVCEKLEKEIVNSWDSWGKFQQQWCHNAFNTFKDYDKYLVLIYLFRQVMQSYSDKFNFFSIDEFYSKDEFVIEKINLIQISADLKIPKETVRRKINEFQDMEILKRQGKQIVLKHSIIQHQRPLKSLDLLSTFIKKQTVILEAAHMIENSPTTEQIKIYFEKYFTVFWLRFFKLQIPFLVNWRETFTDLETWNVWGIIALNHQYTYKKLYDQNIYINDNKVDTNNFYSEMVKAKVKHGINTSSISDISKIPRATVIRKLKWLKKNNLIKKNKDLEYLMETKGKKNKIINKLFKQNRSYASSFVTDVLDLIKDSNFKI